MSSVSASLDSFHKKASVVPISIETVLKGFEECTRQFPEKIRVFTYLCRDEMDGFKRALKSDRPIVIGTTKSLLPTREERLAQNLRHAGYEVIVVNQAYGPVNEYPAKSREAGANSSFSAYCSNAPCAGTAVSNR